MKMMNPTETNNTFLGYFVLFVWGFMLMEVSLGQSQTSEIKVGVVLDIQTNFSKICLTSINMSLSDFYEDHPNYRTRLALHVRDSMEDAVQASAAALDLIKNEKVSAIIGPRSSMQAQFMIRLANKSQVPAITFSATSPLLTSINSHYFVRATFNDLSQVRAIAAIVKSFEWRSVIVIYVDNEFGEGIMPYLFIALQDVQASVVYKCVISLEANDDQIEKELYKLMTQQTRVFVVHMPPNLGFRVIQKAREIKMMEEGYVWLLTDGMTNWIGSNERGSSLENIQGLLGVRSYIPKSKELEHFSLRWKKKFEKDDLKLNVFALRAYDSITALAKAVEKISIRTLRYDIDNGSVSSNEMTDMVTLGVSRHGPSLLKSLSDVRFKGLAGEFKLINRQLESSTFEIINFIGNKERIIGLVNSKSEKRERFRQVIWPGNSTTVPKGWEIPTNGKKLIVGVPMKKGFFDFVEVKRRSINNAETIVTGYSIDVFEAALKKLPYSVIPKYVYLKSPVNYDDLVCNVYNGTWDAVAGDVTIRANRAFYVDFTSPYTESGVFMLVPVKDNDNPWVFLKPWNKDLWITTGCFFVFIGFVMWLLEHRVNDDFRGSPHHQISTSFWFSFSTMVFAHSEKVVSNLARFVVVVWCFVVLVLTQSYTANLSSFLTVQRLRPKTTTVNDLIRNGDSVGYQRGSFVHGLLKNKGFQESKLKPYDSFEECHMLMSNRKIAAAFDEEVYFKVLLSKYCSKYAMVAPSFKSAGFGFVFPKNSPLTRDVSMAILHLSEGDEKINIEKKWLNKQSQGCPDPNPDLSHGLSLSSFWGLFIIAGLASFLALLFYLANFLYEQRHTLLEDSGVSFWRKLMLLLRIFNEKDKISHMFKESAVHNASSPTPRPSAVEITPCPQSPSQNREFEPRRVSLEPSEDFFTPRLEQDEDDEVDTERGAD